MDAANSIAPRTVGRTSIRSDTRFDFFAVETTFEAANVPNGGDALDRSWTRHDRSRPQGRPSATGYGRPG